MSDLAISVGFSGLNAARNDFNRFTASTSRGIGNLNTSTSGLSRGISSIGAAIPGVAGLIGSLVNPLTLAAGAVVGLGTAFSNAVGVARKFQQQIADTAAVVTTGLGAREATRQIKLLSDEAKLLGSTTEFSATQAARAMEQLAKAGFDTKEILAATSQTLSLATVGNLDLARAADISTNVLTQFGLEAEEMGRVVDVIAKTVNSAQTDTNQFADAMNYLGPTARALGISLEEASAAIGILADEGLKGSLGTRALGTSLVRLAAPTKRMQGLINRLGLDFFDAQGNFIGLAGTINELERVLVGATQEQTQYVLSTLFGAEAIQEFNILLKNGSDSLKDYTSVIEAAGAQQGAFSEEIRKAKLDTFEGAVISLQSAWEGFQIAISEGALPGLKEITFVIADVVRGFTRLITSVRDSSSLADVFGPIGAALDNLFSTLGVLGSRISNVFAELFSVGTESGKGFFDIISDIAERALVNLINGLEAAAQAAIFLSDVYREYILPVVRPVINIFLEFLEVVSNIPAIFQGSFAAVQQIASNLVNGITSQFEGVGTVLEGVFSLDPAKIIEGIEQAREGAVLASVGIGRGVGEAYREAYASAIADYSGEVAQSIEQASSEAAAVAGQAGAVAGNTFGGSFTDAVEASAAVGSLKFLQDRLKAVNEAIISLPPDSPALIALTQRAVELEGEIEKVERRIKLLRLGLLEPLELTTVSLAVETPQISVDNIEIPDIAATVDVDGIDNYVNALERIGLTGQFIEENMRNIPALVQAVGSGAFDLGEKLGLSADQAAFFALEIQNLSTDIFAGFASSAANAFGTFGKAIGEAIISGRGFASAFAGLLQGLVSAILVEVPKLIGTFLLQTAVGLGFPAGIPFALAGIGLIGLSGLFGGLLSGIGGGNNSQVANVNPAQLSGNTGSGSTNLPGLSSIAAGEDEPTVFYITNILESDGIAEVISEQQVVAQELTNGRG